MTVRISDDARNAASAAIAALVDGGVAAGRLRVYTGGQPASVATAPTGTLLLDFVLSDPAYAAPIAGSAALDVTPPVAAVVGVSGTAGWFRLSDSTGAGVVDGSVTAAGGGGDLELATNVLVAGVEVTIETLPMIMPAA